MVRTLVSITERPDALRWGCLLTRTHWDGWCGQQSYRWANQKALGALRNSLDQGIWVYFHHFFSIGIMALAIKGKFSH